MASTTYHLQSIMDATLLNTDIESVNRLSHCRN